MQPTIIPAPVATSGPTIPGVSVAVDSGPSVGFGDPLSLLGWLTSEGLWSFLTWLWSVYTILAYIFSILLIVLYVYASVKKNLYTELQTQELRDAERLYAEQYLSTAPNNRLQDVVQHTESDNPNDWKLAIIEADIILDDVLKERGYAGTSLGERLKGISPHQLASLQDAWEAHKVRNQIAHQGADFVLTKRTAQETITRYRRVFAEFGVS